MQYANHQLIKFEYEPLTSIQLPVNAPIYLDLGLSSWLVVIPDAVSAMQHEIDSLWNLHPETRDTITLFGKQHKIPRYQRLYGNCDGYTYSGRTMKSHAISHPLLDRVLQQVSHYENRFVYNGILVNWYESGLHSMGLHADNEPELVSLAPIFSYSFGASRLFRVRPVVKNKQQHGKIDIVLSNCMLLVMGGHMQCHFKHELPKTRRPVTKRINLTVRAFKTD